MSMAFCISKVRENLKANLQKPENYAVFERLKDK